MAGAPTTSVVLATYERADALNLVLRALAEQEGDADFEVVVADDGSGPDVATVVGSWQAQLDVRHVWQPKEGFRKARAMNMGALAARGGYLIFLDADCVPRRRFMASIRRARRPGWFLSTKRILLSESFTATVLDEATPVWRWSTPRWLLRAPREVGRPGYLVPTRDRRRPWRPSQPEFVPPASAYCLFALERRDFERVNGYEGRCTRSNDGEDQDLAIRLRREGLRCGWPGPAATVVHLWHPTRTDHTSDRPRVFRETQASTHVEAVDGLRELEDQESAKRVASSSASSEPV